MEQEKKTKTKVGSGQRASKGSENESEKLENGCESDASSGETKKKYLMFKLQKDTTNFKWEIRIYFSTKGDFK